MSLSDPIHKGLILSEPSTTSPCLCGNYNNQQNDDFKTISGVIEGTAAAFANTWKTAADCPILKVGNFRSSTFELPNQKKSISTKTHAQYWKGPVKDVLQFPKNNLSESCAGIVDPAVYYKNCLTDACSCENSEACMCAALQSYNRACSVKGIILKGWQAKACGNYILKCPKNLVFSFNITSCLPTCRSLSELDMSCNVHFSPLPGCTCDEGSYIDDTGRCVLKLFPVQMLNDDILTHRLNSTKTFNSCVNFTPSYRSICKDRMWKCTKMACLATCTVYGDGHYTTFDGKRYNFNGDCQYTLAQDHCSLNDNDTFRIITENIPCGTTGVTCSKALKVFFGLKSYELILSDKHLNVVQRGTGTSVPYQIRLMGIYLVLETKNGLLLLWDKQTSIFIKVTDTFKGKLCGLCGNYDGNANNDFTTRSNAVVGNIEEFGNSWKMTHLCPDAKIYKDPCSLNPYRLSWAQKQCSIITSEVFSVCHPHVDPSKFYDTCISDSCACNTGGDCECFCTAVAAYAQTCGEYGICVSWRDPNRCPLFCDYYNDDEECEWHYKPCGAPCMKTCRNPSGKCVYEIRGLEGCYPKCPKDRPLFDEDEMKCVSKCGCYDEDRRHYRLGDRVPSRNNCEVCSCTEDGIKCLYIVKECECEYDDHIFKFNETIYNTTDSIGHCLVAICKENGTIYRNIYPCATAVTTPFTFTTVSRTVPTVVSPRTPTVSTVVSSRTPTQTSTATQTVSGTTHSRPTTKIPVFTSTSATAIPSSIVTTSQKPSTICKPLCKWTSWFSVNTPSFGFNGGETENYKELIQKGKQICKYPEEIKCQPKNVIHTIQEEVQQSIHCNLSAGLVCINRDQITNMGMCFDYEISFLCCDDYSHCAITPPSTTTSATKSTYLPPSSKTTQFTIKTTTTKSQTTGKSPTTPKQTVTSPTVIFTTKISTESRIPTISTRKTPTTSVQTGITETKHITSTLLYSTSASTPTATKSRSTATKETITPSTVASTSKISFPTSQISISTKKTPTTSVETEITETKRSTSTLFYSTSASTPSATKSRSTTTKETITPSAVASTSKISFPTSQISISTKKTPTTSVQTEITETKRSTSTLLYSTSASIPSTTKSRSTATKETITPSAVASTSKISFPTSQISISTKKTPTTSVETEITETKRSTSTLFYSTSASTPSATKSRSTTTKETITPSAVASTSKISFPTSQISISTKKTPTTSVQTEITETKRSTSTLLYSTSASIPSATKSRSTATKETITPSAVASTSKISFPTSQISISTKKTPTTSVETEITETKRSTSTLLYSTSASTPSATKSRSTATKETITPSAVASTSKISFPTSQISLSTKKTPTTSVETEITETKRSTSTLLYSTSASIPSATKSRSTATKETISHSAVASTSKISFPTSQISTAISTKITTTSKSPPTSKISTSAITTTKSPITSGQTKTRALTSSLVASTTKISTSTSLPTSATPPIKTSFSPTTPTGTGTTPKVSSTTKTSIYTSQLSSSSSFSTIELTQTEISMPGTSSPTTSTTPTKTTPTITTIQSSTAYPTTTIFTSTICQCDVSGTMYSPGDVVYQTTDMSGCKFYSICTYQCIVEAIIECPTTIASQTSTSTSLTSSTTPVSQTSISTLETKETTVEGCPPRKEGETWSIGNCTLATCLGNNEVVMSLVDCLAVNEIECVNGLRPNRVYSEDGCCFQYECSCVCSGTEDSNFITFDGIIYKYNDLCTQILVEQISPQYDDFKILLEKKQGCSSACKPAEGVIHGAEGEHFSYSCSMKREVVQAPDTGKSMAEHAQEEMPTWREEPGLPGR
ncbi:Hypothetical predicted protein [Pelobates cultripes]|uniref:VWFD domain-containing protein n=1 Tax=Pelobates cultripes TaxID=61616 RepID=A0AAD1TJZ0_PELCU|nr:Hypothetical predicted protein [Pelobates cultripes]